MNKKLFFLILTLCVIFTCTVVLSSCGPTSEDQYFYDKTFVLEKMTVDYDAEIDSVKLSTLLEESLEHIDWKRTLKANASTIDSATFEENVTTLDRAKEIIATFGSSFFGMTFTFASKDAKTATATLKDNTTQLTVQDDDGQGTYATLKNDKGTEEGTVSLGYNETGEIEYLQYMPTEARSFTVFFTEEIPLGGMNRTELNFVFNMNFSLQA